MSITNAFRIALRKASELVYDDSVTDFGLDPADRNVQKAIEAVAEDYYRTSNIVGTVSQSGGVPTGAIIERDSNDDGEYTRFAEWIDFVFFWEKDHCKNAHLLDVSFSKFLLDL